MAASSVTLERQQACGLRVLSDDGPRTGESFEDWIGRIGGDCADWRDGRSVKAMRGELQRLSELWLKRGFIEMPRDKTPRVLYDHCRGVIAAWRHHFSAHISQDMPKGWCNEVPAFDQLMRKAESDLQRRKDESGQLLKRHLSRYDYEDAVLLADGCLTSANDATTLTKRYNLALAHQTVCYGLLGPREQMLSLRQTYSLSMFDAQFGAGRQYASDLFRFNPCERNPPAVDLEHKPKGPLRQTGKKPLVLIPGRIFSLCPLVSTGIVRIIQFGRQFLSTMPPTMAPDANKPDWPYLVTKIDNISAVPAKLDTSTLKDVATSLGLSTEGGLLSQLRNLGILESTADPSCSRELAHEAWEHGRTGVPDGTYKSHHADLTLKIAHYKGSDPRIDAYLCAITDLLHKHDAEMTEMALALLSDGFRASYDTYVASDRTGVARQFYETILFSIKLVIIRSRCRMVEGDWRIYEDSPTALEKFDLLTLLLQPVLNHAFNSTIDAVIAQHEDREMGLGLNATFGAEALQVMDATQRANVDSMTSLLTQQTAHIRGYTLRDMDALEEERDSGRISEAEFQQRLADAQPRHKGSPVEERIVSRLSPDGFALRHSLPMRTEEERRRAADLLEERREDFYPRDIYADAEALASRFDTGKKRERDGTPKPLPLRPPPAAPPALPPPAPVAPPPAALPARPPANELQLRAKNALAACSLKGTVGEIVGRYVHGMLPLLLDGRPLGLPTDQPTTQKLYRQRAILYRALSLTVDTEGQPQPSRLPFELYKVVVSGSKGTWGTELDSDVKDRMEAFVFGGGTCTSPDYEAARANLVFLQEGISQSGATYPERTPAPSPPPPPSERFFVSCDPAIAKSAFGVARIFVHGTSIVRVEYASYKPNGQVEKVCYQLQGKRMLFLKEKLKPIIDGAAGLYVENYKVNSGTINGADTNYFVRAVPIMLSLEAGVPVRDIIVQSWRNSFGGPGGNVRNELAKLTNFIADTSEDAIKSHDAIDAICIGLHCLLERGFSLAVRSLAPM